MASTVRCVCVTQAAAIYIYKRKYQTVQVSSYCFIFIFSNNHAIPYHTIISFILYFIIPGVLHSLFNSLLLPFFLCNQFSWLTCFYIKSEIHFFIFCNSIHFIQHTCTCFFFFGPIIGCFGYFL